MANSKISALTSATTPLAGTETLPVVQSSATTKVTVANLTAGRAVSVASLTATTGSVAANTSTFSGASISGITAASKASTDLVGTYPNGLSFTVVNGGTGWPLGSQGVLITYYSNTYGADGIGFSYQEFIVRDQVAYGNRRTFRRYPSSVAAGAAWGNWLETIVADTSTGNITVTGGNYIPATAAKGVNFTANTPLAGMTSQLLNWYEEGTWTPNQGAGLTLVGAFSSTGRYTRIGRQVSISGTVTGATSVAVTAAGVITSNLPFTVVTAGHGDATNVAVNASATVICTGTSVTAAAAIAATVTITFSATYFV